MRIVVTQRDIDEGKVGEKIGRTQSCPIAQSLKRRHLPFVGVTKSGIVTIFGRLVLLPPKAQQFIADFDAGKPVSPFHFEVSL